MTAIAMCLCLAFCFDIMAFLVSSISSCFSLAMGSVSSASVCNPAKHSSSARRFASTLQKAGVNLHSGALSFALN